MQNKTTLTEVRNETIKESYYHIAHKSGLHIYVVPKKMSTAYALFGTHYGAIDNCFRLEGDSEFTRVPDGIAHFLEHKMFENEDGSDTNEKFTRLGASCNAYTSHDLTAYEFSCTENFYESLGVLLDYVRHPYFTEENIAKEQGIIGQEIGMYDDNPTWRIFYELLNLLYVKSNARINVAGTVETIAEITPEHLYRCYNTFYRLTNMALVICGDVEPKKVCEVADAYLPELTDDAKIERSYPAEPRNVNAKRSTLRLDVGKTQFAIGVKDVRVRTGDEADVKHRITLEILNDMLFGISGKFYNESYDAGLINNSFSSFYEASGMGAFLMLTGESDDPEGVYDRFVSAVREAKKNPPSRSDFERMKRVEYSSYVRGFDSTDGIANRMLSDLFDGADSLAYGDILAEVTYEDVLTALNEFFDEELYVMAVIEPEHSGKEE